MVHHLGKRSNTDYKPGIETEANTAARLYVQSIGGFYGHGYVGYRGLGYPYYGMSYVHHRQNQPLRRLYG